MSPRRSRHLRLTTIAAAALVASSVFAACGAEDDEPASATEETSHEAPQEPSSTAEESILIPAAEGKVEYPVTLETAWGDVTIEERPERIVAASWRGDLSWLIALGITPVAVESAEWAMDAVPWAEESLAQPIEHTWEYDDLAIEAEAVAASDPDLIVAGSIGAEAVPNLDQLSAVAPVLAQPDTGEDYAGWRANLLLIGEALDLQDRAQQVIDEYDAYFEDLQAEYPEFAGKTLAFVGFHGKNDVWYGNSSGSVIEEFFTRQGFAENPNTELTDVEALSPELIGKIEGDVLVVVDYSPPDDEGKEFGELVESSLFQSLPAVQNGNLLLLASPERTELFKDGELVGPMPHPSVAYDDPTGSPQLAELLAPLIFEALAG